MDNQGTFKNLKPVQLLTHLASTGDTAHLQVSSNSVIWSFYLKHGKIIYAANSVDPFDRLERHLRRLSHQLPHLNSETRTQLRMLFENDSDSLENYLAEYKAICWLFSNCNLTKTQIAALIKELVAEVVESFLLIHNGTYTIQNYNFPAQELCQLDLQQIIERCQKELQIWQSLQPYISSPYQRPYLLLQTKAMQIKFPQLQQEITYWMKGFSLRHLAILLKQEELELAQKLQPYIAEGYVVLHEPDPPFDKLPRNLAKLSEISVARKEFAFKIAVPLQKQREQQQEASVAHNQTAAIGVEARQTTAATIPVVLPEKITAEDKAASTPDNPEITDAPLPTVVLPEKITAKDKAASTTDNPEITATPLAPKESISTVEPATATPDHPQTTDVPLSVVALTETITARENAAIAAAKTTGTSQPLVQSAQLTRVEAIKQPSTESDTESTSIADTDNPTPVVPTNTYTIVCVDDSPTMLKELSHFLSEEMFAVVTISNPVKALMSIIRNQPDLILLDVNMDGIDGYELCRLLRNNSQFKATPIVMVTGNKGIIDRVKARLVGASGYLTKPFTKADLLKMVFRHIA
jgi:CheY-like chemotaxis protein